MFYSTVESSTLLKASRVILLGVNVAPPGGGISKIPWWTAGKTLRSILKDSNFSLRSLSSRQPNVVTITKMAQMPSRRTANQREVVRNRNQASVGDDTVLVTVE